MADPPAAHCGRFMVPADHPCLPGHFPGYPIVPGVVLLDHVLGLVRDMLPERRLCSVRNVRFRQPVGPGQVVDVELRAARGGELDFIALRNAEPVLSGSFRLDEPARL